MADVQHHRSDDGKRRNTERSNSDLTAFLLLLLLAFYGPATLIWLDIIPFALRFHSLLISAVGLAVYVVLRGYSRRQLGLRTDNLKDALLINMTFSAAAVGALTVVYGLGLIRAPTVPTWNLFFPLYVVLFCPAQEFTCRAVLFAELERLKFGPVAQVLITAITYAFIHIIYRDLLILAATFVIGVAWGAIYWFRPNFYAVSLSHAALGVTSILVGLV